MQIAVFFDIDGTLRDMHTGTIPDSAIAAVRKLRDAGCFLGIASGRLIHEIDDDIRGVVDWDAYVLMNGQEVYTKRDGKIYGVTVPDAIVRKCLEVAERSGMTVQLVTGDDPPYHTREPNGPIRRMYEMYGIALPRVKPYGGETIKSIVLCGSNEDSFGEYKQIDGIDVCPGIDKAGCGAVYADVVLDGVSKYSGIKKAMERNGICEYIAFGDALNDIEMLRHAKISVAMGGSPPATAAAATYLAQEAADGGIAEACESLGLYDMHIKTPSGLL